MSQVLYIGDSYCSSHLNINKNWPIILANKLQKNCKVFSYPGGSLVSQLHAVIDLTQQQIDSSDMIIFCHTHPQRIPSHIYWKLNIQDNYFKNKKEFQEKFEADYHKYISDAVLEDFIESRWYEWVVKKFEGKKLIHLHSFDDSLLKIDLLKGINITPSLKTISYYEWDRDLNHDPRPNHMCAKNNIILAEQLYEIISKNDSGIFSLDMDKFVKKNV